MLTLLCLDTSLPFLHTVFALTFVLTNTNGPRYVLLDSWWYYQGVGSGVSNWIGRPDIFPHGNDYLRNATGWPIMGHNRFWAVDNAYATQNGGQYDFVVEMKGVDGGRDYAWPTEQRFWDDLLYNSSKWGLFMYEQDWLDTEYDNVMYVLPAPALALIAHCIEVQSWPQ